MKIEDVKNVLKDVSFAPSNLDMGWGWDIKHTKIYDDNNIVLEKGYSIRTTFMRPDANTGEIEKGYGRWMYVPENISKDGLVKTAWVCADLIVKHELMEAFLYERKRIFDPHKSLDDLQHNGRTVDVPKKIEGYKLLDSGYYLSDEDGRIYEKIDDKMVLVVKSKKFEKPEQEDTVFKLEKSDEGVKVTDESVQEDTEEKSTTPSSATPSSSEIFQKQNLGNHILEVSDFLDSNFKKNKTDNPDVVNYRVDEKLIIHNTKEGMVQLAFNGGRLIDVRHGENYNLSDVEEMLKDLVNRVTLADPAEVNVKIQEWGYTEGKQMDGDNDDVYWIYTNPSKQHRFIIHSESDKSLALINQNKDILKVLEGEDYVMDKINTFFN